MKTIHIPILTVLLLVTAGTTIAREKISLITAVHSKTLNGYQRAKGADGRFKPEYYALSIGGKLSGTLSDSSIEKVPVPQLAGVLGQFLAQQNYHLAPDAKSTDLLLLVNWGKTNAYRDADLTSAINRYGSATSTKPGSGDVDQIAGAVAEIAMLNRLRDLANEGNARLLGYIDEVNRISDHRIWSAGGNYYQELIGDLEDPRYYLFVSAYDFSELARKKNPKLLWCTRVSIRAPGSSFERDFAAMLAKAAHHFGQDSGGLLRRYDPRGRVDIGDIEVIGMSSTPDHDKSK